MEEEKKLYPLKFVPISDEYDWGTDTFCVADLGYRDTFVREGWLSSNTLGEIMDTYIDRVVGDNVYQALGRQFPVQVKRIRVNGRMPLRVHPDAETAFQRYDQLGREKMWYVLKAGKDAALMAGFKKDTDAGEVYQKCLDSTIDGIMNVFTPHAGQIIHIRPGVPHAASGDVEILEISESSSMDFCMCPWGQILSEEEFEPGCTIIQALDFIDYRAFCPESLKPEGEGDARKLLSLPEFAVSQISLDSALHSCDDQFDSYILYSCVSGAVTIRMETDGLKLSFPLREGETMLVPSECQDFYLVPEDGAAILLETTTPYHEEKDPYINPDVEAELPQ